MRLLSCAFASVILFKVAWLAVNYMHPVPIRLAIFAMSTSFLAILFALAGLPRRRPVNRELWRE